MLLFGGMEIASLLTYIHVLNSMQSKLKLKHCSSPTAAAVIPLAIMDFQTTSRPRPAGLRPRPQN